MISFPYRFLHKQMTSVLIKIAKQKILRQKQDGVNTHQIQKQVECVFFSYCTFYLNSFDSLKKDASISQSLFLINFYLSVLFHIKLIPD